MNLLIPFKFDNHIAHGAFVVIDTGAAEMLDMRAYDPAVRGLVAQTMAAMPLLATHTRFEGRINLQFQGERAIKLLVAQVVQREGAPLTVRAMAKAAPQIDGSYAELLSDGVLALMLEPADDAQPSRQAMVPIDGDSLSESLEGYFAQSEQLPTLVRLAAEGDRIAGFMLQRLPLEHTKATEEVWEHLAILAGTLSTNELLTAEPETLMRRLFANEDWQLYEAQPVNIACRCSREGISLLLLSLGRDEVDKIVAEQGKVEIICEFCGRDYVYSRSDAATLFVAEGSEQSQLKH
ncbi:Hsp33 family molecular chaperone HslO [Nevskia ramosa]|uniref:Hsp33 family molecular chaperone HslO n=1 Tax=Nevskia ramosa TaxID=64002 RepID=UPI0023541228|nr:Hsp33 family molecular chaperone HslO [Nevskia ramosa]